MEKVEKGGGKTDSLLQILLPLILITFILLWLPLTFEVFYRRDKENDLLICSLFVVSKWHLYRLEIPEVQASLNVWGKNLLALETEMLNSRGEQEQQEIKINKPDKLISDVWPRFRKIYRQFKKIYKKLSRINKDFFKTITCKELFWHTEIGFSDAAVTALTTGFLWNAKNFIYSNLHKNVQVGFAKPSFGVKPIFGVKRFYINFKCIFAVRLGHIIFTGLKLFMIILWSIVIKGGGQAERSSN